MGGRPLLLKVWLDISQQVVSNYIVRHLFCKFFIIIIIPSFAIKLSFNP